MISNGQAANETNFNNAFMSRTDDTGTVGIVELNNADAESGDAIENVQREINALSLAVGRTVGDTIATGYAWTNNDVGAVDDSVALRADLLTERFNGTTGHSHTGGAGQGAPINTASLVSGDTESDDKDTGCLVLEGGLGVEKNINAGGDVSGLNLRAAGSVIAQGDLEVTSGVSNLGFTTIYALDIYSNFITHSDAIGLSPGDNDDLDLSGYPYAEASGSADANLNGVINGLDGKHFFIKNNLTKRIVVKHEKTSSTAANRFSLPNSQDMIIPPKAGAHFIYDSSVSRWCLLGSSGSSGLIVTGTRAAPTNVTAAGGIVAPISARQLAFVKGNSAGEDISANPQIAAGYVIGQELTLRVPDGENGIKLENGNGLSQNGDFVLGVDKFSAKYVWDGTEWFLTGSD